VMVKTLTPVANESEQKLTTYKTPPFAAGAEVVCVAGPRVRNLCEPEKLGI
jgi:hypothetical protein